MLLLVVVILASSTIAPHTEGMGVRYEDIPEGNEDLYILKSDILNLFTPIYIYRPYIKNI